MAFGEPYSATSLSLKYEPGKEEFYAPTASESIFTFGDFKLERSVNVDTLSAETQVVLDSIPAYFLSITLTISCTSKILTEPSLFTSAFPPQSCLPRI